MAKEKGMYEEVGLDVDILRGGPEAPSSRLLTENKADIGMLFLSKGIQMRANGVKLVNIDQFVQRSSLMLVAKKSSNRCCC